MQTTQQPYWEAQNATCCMLHSINAYIGARAITVASITRFIREVKMNAWEMSTEAKARMNMHYRVGKNPGSFSVPIMNAYIHEKMASKQYLQPHILGTYTPARPYLHEHKIEMQKRANAYENTEKGISGGSSTQQIIERIDVGTYRVTRHIE